MAPGEAGEVRHLHLCLEPALVRGVAAGAGLDPDKAELVEGLFERAVFIADVGIRSSTQAQDSATRSYGFVQGPPACWLLSSAAAKMLLLARGTNP